MTTKISVDQIKELRDKTGVPMAKCKAALSEAGGDMELAIENLRKQGVASAVKKEGRETKEGKIGFAESNKAFSLVEVNAETDFVVNNDKFQSFVREIAEEVAATCPSSTEAFLEQALSKDSAMTVDAYRANLVQTIGENIQIKRLATFPKKSGQSVGIYSHMGGKIVVAIVIEGKEGLESFAKDIAMHAAAASPEFVSSQEVPSNVIEKEKEIAKEQIQGNKPPEVVEKILLGKVNAFFKSACLLDQQYIRDESVTVAKLLESKGKEVGADLKITKMERWKVGS